MKVNICTLFVLMSFIYTSEGAWVETFDTGTGRFQYCEANGSTVFNWNLSTQSLDATFIRRMPPDRRYTIIPTVNDVLLGIYGFSTIINITGQTPGAESDPACAHFGFMNSADSQLHGALLIEAEISGPSEAQRTFFLWTAEQTTETIRTSTERITFEYGTNYFIHAWVNGYESVFYADFYAGEDSSGSYLGSLSVELAPGVVIGFDALGFTGWWDSQQTVVQANFDNFAFLTEPTPPVADADGPYTIYIGDTLTLDASGSTDDGNDVVSYLWDLDDNNSFETDAGDQPVFDVNFTYLQSLGLLVDNTYNIHLKVTDSEGQSDVNDTILTILPIPALQVVFDIKPGSCPNPVNVKSSGVLPVAILGTNDYDIATIDPTSIRLAGVEPLRSNYEDVATPVSDINDCNCTSEGPDGFLDLTLKFKTQKIVEAIGDVNEGDVLTLELTGILCDPISFETPIVGTDCILIRGSHKPFNKADINKDSKVDCFDFAIIAENWLTSIIEE